MRITLYQIIPELDNGNLMFRDLQFIRTASGNRVPAEHYEIVYSGELNAQTLEDVFYIFNIEHPEGYCGRSMSVSDVVEVVVSESESEFFFCNTVGFEKIDFDKEKAMLPIFNHDFQTEEIIRCGNFRIVFCTEFGVSTVWCSKVVLTRCQYSECQLGYKLIYWPWDHGHSREKQFLTRPKVLLARTGFHSIPESVFYVSLDGNLRKSRFPVYSDDNFRAVEQWCKEQNIAFEYL